MPQPPRDSASSWIDLKIPLWGVITLAIGLLAQSASLLIWGAQMDDRVAQNSRDISGLRQRMDTMSQLAVTVARMDERTQALTVTVNRIDNRLNAEKR